MGELFLGRYEVEREVGQGGMAAVYRGLDHVLGRPVAIKVLHSHLLQKEEARARFEREARVIARLRHPGIVEVYDFAGLDSERAFLVAEFVDGESLAAFIARVPVLPPEVAALIVASAGDALAHAHEHGVIHRDVKPDNLMVRRDGVLKLMDFGIAHVVDMEHLTMTGAVLGSPAHMSPEQVDGRALDARTDVFSLGTLFYLLATGRYPFEAPMPSAMLRAIAEARFPDPRTVQPGFPDDLVSVLLRMMEREPDRRYPSAREATDALVAATAALGFGPPSAELPRLFADPAGYCDGATARIAAARVRRAAGHLSAGRPALAIREADAALACRPGDPDARRVLDRARRSARRSRVSRVALAWTGAALAVAAVVVAGWTLWPERPPENPASSPAGMRDDAEMRTVPAPRRPSSAPALPPPVAGSPSRDRAPSRPADPSGTGRTPPPRPGPALMPVTIQAHPPAVQIEIDGRAVGEGRVEGLMLPPGRHVVRLTHPSCDVCREVGQVFVLDPAAPMKGPLRLSIAYQDAILVVAGPPGARVFVNDEERPRGAAGQPLRYGMAAPGPVQVKVRVEEDGRDPRTYRVPLSAGRTTTIAGE